MTYTFQEYPKAIGGRIVKDAAEEAKLRAEVVDDGEPAKLVNEPAPPPATEPAAAVEEPAPLDKRSVRILRGGKAK